MADTKYTEIRNVIVDGNRPSFGAVPPSVILGRTSALIFAGGTSAYGQVISHVQAFEPRSSSCIHIHEGDKSDLCESFLLENNQIGPSGSQSGSRSPRANAIAFACSKSYIRNNTIVDATYSGIVLFGAPGTIVENNVVVAESKNLLSAISMIQFHPYAGDFTDTVVRNNVIHAKGATINIGIAMGSHLSTCGVKMDQDLLYGGIVTSNRLEGNHMGYGFPVNGVRNWTVVDNIDASRHTGTPSKACMGQLQSSPEGFQINSDHSYGTFQPEYEQANLDNIVTTLYHGSVSSHQMNHKQRLRLLKSWQDDGGRSHHPITSISASIVENASVGKL
jgi:parallel beta-helix repeat protein